MKPLRNKLIQSRLDEDEMADFDKVKKLLGEENNSKAVRQMIKDEMMLKKAEEEWKKGNTELLRLLNPFLISHRGVFLRFLSKVVCDNIAILFPMEIDCALNVRSSFRSNFI